MRAGFLLRLGAALAAAFLGIAALSPSAASAADGATILDPTCTINGIPNDGGILVIAPSDVNFTFCRFSDVTTDVDHARLDYLEFLIGPIEFDLFVLITPSGVAISWGATGQLAEARPDVF